MTRPETLVRQLANAVINPLLQAERDLQRKAFPPPPVTVTVRRLYYEYRSLSKATEAAKRRLEKAGGRSYTSNGKPMMQEDGSARTRAHAEIRKQVARAQELRDAAMLAVLGLDAAKARPIVLKLKKDLERLGRG